MPEKNTTMQKTLLIIISVVLVVAIGVGASLAYLTDRREDDTTYTVGKVKVTLSGTGVGKQERLYPGKKMTKQPVVTIDADSEPCFVRLKVTFPDELALVLDPFVSSDAGEGWALEAESPTLYYFTYNKMLTNDSGMASDRVTATAAFDRVVTSGNKPVITVDTPGYEFIKDMTHVELLDRAHSKRMVIEVQAIQAGGFSDANDAFAHYE